MSGRLRIWIDIDDDGVGKLFAEFKANGFSGQGNAYFSLESLTKSAEKFAQYPFLAGQFPCLEGGYWSKDDASKLSQEHLHISAYPTNSRGGIGLLVRVAEPQDDLNRPESRYSASAEFKTSYEQMAKFSRDLISLVRGNIAEVVFDELVVS